MCLCLCLPPLLPLPPLINAIIIHFTDRSMKLKAQKGKKRGKIKSPIVFIAIVSIVVVFAILLFVDFWNFRQIFMRCWSLSHTHTHTQLHNDHHFIGKPSTCASIVLSPKAVGRSMKLVCWWLVVLEMYLHIHTRRLIWAWCATKGDIATKKQQQLSTWTECCCCVVAAVVPRPRSSWWSAVN